MAFILPQPLQLDGRALPSSADANVTVWPYNVNGEYDANQKGTATRATTINSTTNRFAPGQTHAEWNGVWYFMPIGQSVTIPYMVYLILLNNPGISVS